MTQKHFLFFILILIIVSEALAQKSRTSSMGGLSFSINDKDESFDLFEFGGNPAWLINNEPTQVLEMSPGFSNSWGNYRRLYSPEGTMNYNIGFVGVKPLGTAGTFRGSAIYNYEMRRKNYRTLKRETYGGEAFFFIDTTAGDFRYNGPTFQFMHSLELFDDLYVGAEVNYQISDGLKKVYTFAQTLYRNVSGNIGIAYKLSNELSVGANYILSDGQERIEASDVNLLTVQTYHYRGETYALELRGSNQNYKLKKAGNSFGGQLYWNSKNELEIGIKGNYLVSNSSVLFPVGSIIDTEDGYSQFDQLDLRINGRYKISDELIVGFTTGYFNDKSWSKNSKRDLLLWEWNLDDFNAGIGSSFQIVPNKLLLGIEYEAHKVNSDSSKYVDNKTCTLESFDHRVRAGLEYSISNNLKFRAGYNFTALEHDFIYGGNDIQSSLFTIGFGISAFESMEADARIEYSNTSLSNRSDIKRSHWGGYITLRFFNF